MPTPTLHVPRWRWPWPLRVLAACIVAMMWWLAMYWLAAPEYLADGLVSFWEWARSDVPTHQYPRGPSPLTPMLQVISEIILVGVVGLPGMLIGLRLYHRLTFKFYRDEHLRCTCGYILKGLTEPRCPECGKGI